MAGVPRDCRTIKREIQDFMRHLGEIPLSAMPEGIVITKHQDGMPSVNVTYSPMPKGVSDYRNYIGEQLSILHAELIARIDIEKQFASG